MITQILENISPLINASHTLFSMVFGLFFIDAFVPILPELFVVVVFLASPTWASAFLIVIAAMLGDVTGNIALYLILKRYGMPEFIKRLINRYADFLIIKREKIVLINRIIPLVPIIGPFIAVCNWNLRKTMLYIAIGGMIKNIFLLILAGVFHYMYDQRLAQNLSLVAVVLIMIVSFASSKRKNTDVSL